MIESRYSVCPGCGVRLPVAPEAFGDGRAKASAECWWLYGELTVYTLSRGYDEFIHQLAVDAYGAQHLRPDGPAMGGAFALIGLYLACERGCSGRQVQHMHVLLARRSKIWPRFVPPPHVGEMTVLDVLRARPDDERDAALRRWCQTVWDAWAAEHERVRELVAAVMGA